MRPKKQHWDDVIAGYKEMELHDPTGKVQTAVRDVQSAFRTAIADGHADPDEPQFTINWLPTHALAYPPAPEGGEQQLKPHVDSTRFSGEYVCGYTLKGGGERVLRLRWSEDPECVEVPESDLRREDRGMVVDVPLQEGSGYVLSGMARYNMTHEVVGGGGEERIVAMFRDVKRDGRVPFGIREEDLEKEEREKEEREERTS